MKYSTVPQPSDVAMTLAQRVVKLRKARGWTQAELAQRSEVSLGSLKRFEQQGKIALGKLLNLAQVLNRLNDFDGVFLRDEALLAAERAFREMDGV